MRRSTATAATSSRATTCKDRVAQFLDDVVGEIVEDHTAEGHSDDWDFDALWNELKTIYPISITVDEVLTEAGSRGRISESFLRSEILSDAQAGLRPPRAVARRTGHARARASRCAQRHRPPLARPPLRDGLPQGRHRTARHGPARPAGRVPARGLRAVPADDGLNSRGDHRLPVQPRGRGDRRLDRRRSWPCCSRPLRRARSATRRRAPTLREASRCATSAASSSRPRRLAHSRRSRRRSPRQTRPSASSSRSSRSSPATAAAGLRNRCVRSEDRSAGSRPAGSAQPGAASGAGEAHRPLGD